MALKTLAQILIDGPVVVLTKRLDVMVKWKAWAADRRGPLRCPILYGNEHVTMTLLLTGGSNHTISL